LSIALQDDGKIVGGGNLRLALPNDNQKEVPFVARLTADGDVDTTFGGDGGVIIDPPGVATATSDRALVHEVAVADSGKIVAVGEMRQAAEPGTGGFVARYNPDGTADTGFDGDGFKLLEPLAVPLPRSIEARTVITLPGDELLVGGMVNDFNNDTDDAVIYRYNADGSLDTAFGQQGVLRSEGIINKMVLTADGGILALTQRNTENNTGLQAYDADGNPDTAYGPGGAALLHERSATFGGFALDAEGRALYTVDTTFARAGVRPNAAIGENGTLIVTGDDTAASEINVAVSGDNIIVTRNGTDFTFAAEDISGVDVRTGSGADRVQVAAEIGPRVIATVEGNDTITTAAGYDDIDAGDGDDIVTTRGGGDVITGGSGNDLITTGNGNDSIIAGAGNDTVYAAGGDDLITAVNFFGIDDDADTHNVFHGQDGNDTIKSASGHDSLYGGAGRDLMFGGAGSDLLSGGGGKDRMGGGGGNDRLYGGAGNDQMAGGPGNDRLFGQAGNDKIFGGSGRDLFDGGDGNDIAVDPFGEDGDTIVSIEQAPVDVVP